LCSEAQHTRWANDNPFFFFFFFWVSFFFLKSCCPLAVISLLKSHRLVWIDDIRYGQRLANLENWPVVVLLLLFFLHAINRHYHDAYRDCVMTDVIAPPTDRENVVVVLGPLMTSSGCVRQEPLHDPSGKEKRNPTLKRQQKRESDKCVCVCSSNLHSQSLSLRCFPSPWTLSFLLKRNTTKQGTVNGRTHLLSRFFSISLDISTFTRAQAGPPAQLPTGHHQTIYLSLSLSLLYSF
jgi:hypothetical protein